MSKRKILTAVLIVFFITACFFSFISCSNENSVKSENTTCQDQITNRVSMGKKYYYLGYDNYVENEYYTFNEDGTATYTHIMKNGNQITFHQVINFKWTYLGEGNCVLIHNGTQMLKGEQDDALGFSRVMRVGKDLAYWSASGENTYYVSEDYLSQIPNYAKLLTAN